MHRTPLRRKILLDAARNRRSRKLTNSAAIALDYSYAEAESAYGEIQPAVDRRL